jgi:hypothetical protein
VRLGFEVSEANPRLKTGPPGWNCGAGVWGQRGRYEVGDCPCGGVGDRGRRFGVRPARCGQRAACGSRSPGTQGGAGLLAGSGAHVAEAPELHKMGRDGSALLPRPPGPRARRPPPFLPPRGGACAGAPVGLALARVGIQCLRLG